MKNIFFPGLDSLKDSRFGTCTNHSNILGRKLVEEGCSGKYSNSPLIWGKMVEEDCLMITAIACLI